MPRQKEKNFTPKDRDIIRYFLSNGNRPAIQKQISEGAKVSKRHLGDLRDENRKVKKEGRLSILEKKGIFKWKFCVVYRSGDKKCYYLIEDINTFKQIAKIFLNSDDTLMFMNSEYTQSVRIKYVFDMVLKNFGINLSQGWNVEDLIKKIITKSPSVLEYVLTDQSKEEIDAKKSLFGKFLFGRRRGNGIDTLAFFSILFYADIAKYPDLARTTEDIRRGIDNLMMDLVLEKSRKAIEEFHS